MVSTGTTGSSGDTVQAPEANAGNCLRSGYAGVWCSFILVADLRIRKAIRKIPYSIPMRSRVFCPAYKTLGGGMYSQRKKDRRDFGGKTSFPLKTNGGCLVEKDRRSTPDRRLGNIHLEVIDAGDHVLPDYLSNTELYPSGKVGC
jgi:hypothetical protein